MAMAAARRLGGVTLRPAVEQHSLALLRPLHSQAKAQKAADLLAEIEEAKEELFSQMLENRQVLGVEDCGLLKHLCLQVEPRPDDPAWRFYRRAKLLNYFWKYAGPFFSGYVVTHHYVNIAKSNEALNKSKEEPSLV